MKRLAFTLLLVAGLFACTDDDNTESSEYLVDTDHSGAVDCADLEHVAACTQHPDTHECADADVTHDGHIDAHDTQAIHDALAHAGHDCSSPH
jgi:hypothetical protein